MTWIFLRLWLTGGAFLVSDNLDVAGLLNLPLIYYITVECWWRTFASSFVIRNL